MVNLSATGACQCAYCTPTATYRGTWSGTWKCKPHPLVGEVIDNISHSPRDPQAIQLSNEGLAWPLFLGGFGALFLTLSGICFFVFRRPASH